MKNFRARQFVILVGAMVINIFLVWFGIKLLSSGSIASHGQLFLLGLVCTLCGLFTLSSNVNKKEIWGVSFFLVGLYAFARASTLIERAWLGKILGIASIVAAIVLTYIVIPRDKAPDN